MCHRIIQEENKSHLMELRNTETYKAKMANTEGYKDSAIPYMQRLINKHEQKQSYKKTHRKAS